MPAEALSARDLTRRLIVRASTRIDRSDDTALAVHAASERACSELSRSLGPAGFKELLTRALAQEQGEHPLLKELRIGGPPQAVLGGVTEIVETQGAAAVGAALEAVLQTMIGLVGRLIGVDMVARLLERSATTGTEGEET